MKPKNQENWKEKLYDIIGKVIIPNHKDWGGEEEMSLFDITMKNKNEEEGVILANKLKRFISQLIAKERDRIMVHIVEKERNLFASQKAEIAERLKKIKRKPIRAFGDEDLVDGYNQALADAIKVVEDGWKI